MKYLFYLVHPAHFHLFRFVIKELRNKNHSVNVIIRPKDELEKLCKSGKIEYLKVSDGKRKQKKISMINDIVKRDYHAFKLIRKIKPDLMIGSSAEITHIGKILKIPSVITHEDDYDNMKYFSFSSFPFATNILSPVGCRQGKWWEKCRFYNGYHELAYLHPDVFNPDYDYVKSFTNEKYYLIRFSQFRAHHDIGINGISDSLAMELIKILELHGKIFISSERELPPALEKYRLNIDPLKIHHFLNYAELYIGDSQTMSVEAAILGVPSIRFNKFAENYSITIIDELEQKYKLTISINNSNPGKLLSTVRNLIEDENSKEIWKKQRNKLLSEKINTVDFLIWYLENYPESNKLEYELINL